MNIGLLGCGNVGSGVAQLLLEDGKFFNKKLNLNFNLVKVMVRNIEAERPYNIDKKLLTTQASEIIGNPNIPIVVEVLGGIEPAKTLILQAIASGQHIVTANKALLATHGPEIFAKAKEKNVEIMFEAAVAGAIPIISTLKNALVANNINSIFGILNGTTNYILSEMTHKGLSFEEVLKEAQAKGYAEADPTFDVEGIDAAHKLILLTALAYGIWVKLEDIHVAGISQLKPLDFEFAKELGHVIKLLGLARKRGNEVEVRLHPVMISNKHILADVNGAMNAVHLNGHASGDIFLHGPGAGMLPTASSIMGDVIEIARNLNTKCALRVPPLAWAEIKTAVPLKIANITTEYYLRFFVKDQPGVLAAIAGIFSNHKISIAQVIQKAKMENAEGVPLVILTHKAKEEHVQKAILDCMELNTLLDKPRLIRLESEI